MSPDDFTRKSEQLQAFLEPEAAELSRETGMVQRERTLTGEVMAKMLVLGMLENAEATLGELAQVGADLGVDVTPQAIDQRINERTVRFMQQLFTQSIDRFRSTERLPSPLLKQFSAVNIVDSSVIMLPDELRELFAGYGAAGSEAAMKVQLSVEYLTGSLNALKVVAGRSPDQRCTLHTDLAQPGSLNLFDLGFFKQDIFRDLTQGDAYFISRWQHQTALYEHEDAPIKLDVPALLRALRTDRYQADLYLGSRSRVPVRVLFQRLPTKVVTERRRKAKARKNGKTLSHNQWVLLAWAICITNVSADRLTFEQVMRLYRLRWQIELTFKLWKSQAKLDRIGHWRADRLLCQVYARLIGLVIFYRWVAPYRVWNQVELSVPKAFAVFQRHITRLLDAIAQGWHTVPQVLARIIDAFLRFAPKTARKKMPSTWHQILALEA
jgi:hypothetical protein